MLVYNDKLVWEQVYDKYAPMMYGTILNMTGDPTIAGVILNKAFLEMKEEKLQLHVNSTFSRYLLRYTYTLTLSHLKTLGLKPVTAQPLQAALPLINQCYFEPATIKDIAVQSDTTRDIVLKKLRDEFNFLRDHNRQQTTVSEKQ